MPDQKPTVTGTIYMIGETQVVSDRFQKRELVIEYVENPQYPEYIKFEVVQDKCDLLDQFQVGMEVQVHYDLKGRKYNDKNTGEEKIFSNLQAWRVVAVGQQAPPQQHPGDGQQQAPQQQWQPPQGPQQSAPFQQPVPPAQGTLLPDGSIDDIPF